MKRIISVFLIFALAIPLLSACAKPNEAQSEIGENSSQGGSALPFDPTVPQNVDSGTYSYYIYDGSESLNEWIGGFGILDYFYRITNSSKVAERILDRPIREFGGFGTEFVAITKDCKLIRFPNIADVPEGKITYLGVFPLTRLVSQRTARQRVIWREKNSSAFPLMTALKCSGRSLTD